MITAPSPRDLSVDRVGYQKLPTVKETYLAYVVAIRDPLNLHLDIYWPPEISERYNSALHYDYTFVSEELDRNIQTRSAYSCHLRGIEIVSTSPTGTITSPTGTTSPQGAIHSHNMKEAYIEVSKNVIKTGGWVLVSISDIDIYRRILVNVFEVVTRKSINTALLEKISTRTGDHIAKEYSRPLRSKPMFSPTQQIPKDYHIVYGGNKEKKK